MEKFSLKKIPKYEIKKFQLFVKKNWPRNKHVFTTKKGKNLINFYYNYNSKTKTNLVGQYNNNHLLSVIGLIPNNNWDKKLKKDYFIAFLLKSKITINSTFIFFNFIFKKIRPNFLAVSGINLDTSGKIFSRFNPIKSFSHFYILNRLKKSKITKNLNNYKKKNYQKNYKELSLKISRKLVSLPKSNYNPKKSKKFFTNKYIKNPYYKYFVMNFSEKNKLKFFFICREIILKKYKTKIIRIIDFHGIIPKKCLISGSMQQYLKKNKIDYIDILCDGFYKNVLENIGFLKKNNKQIIPNHFEPYTGKDARLNYCILLNKYKKNTILFKGDGDQDRPNII